MEACRGRGDTSSLNSAISMALKHDGLLQYTVPRVKPSRFLQYNLLYSAASESGVNLALFVRLLVVSSQNYGDRSSNRSFLVIVRPQPY